MEGWEIYALRGAGVALHSVDDTCFVVCGVWDERDRKMRHFALRYAYGFGPSCDNVLSTMEEHTNFKWINDTVDQNMNLYFRFRGGEYLGGGQMTMMRKLSCGQHSKLFCGQHFASSYSRNTKSFVFSITTKFDLSSC